MTRINIIPPKELSDQHLVAEYREIFMVGPSLQRSLRSNKWNKNRIPKKYTLGKGHVMFFYDKGIYLKERYKELRNEMLLRGMNPNEKRIFIIDHFPNEYRNNWVPNSNDFQIIRERIQERISKKPNWYRFSKKQQ